ncbi:MAG: carboxylating nicotinate-nucleotide diphosphorylase [Odoribacteraceae bacterium]|jgi:nicotinate-nucleotide pyrophosphorylase (carboxylating)|nr:carboxylating nicotinate-nucleotide diphosphorylase [Odoribacteraceae bacterium]
MTTDQLVERLLDLALEEDVATGDLTTNAIIPARSRARATLTARAPGVVSGLAIAPRVFARLDPSTRWQSLVADGERVNKGDIIARVDAHYRALLTGERVALNILQRMSGIATATAAHVQALEGSGARLLDTRKTAPGMRVLDKMAVAHGGGQNHRMGLHDMILIKDNHIKIAGGIPAAARQARACLSPGVQMEIETANLDEVQQALDAGADIIMLDNMTTEEMARAVRLINRRARVEASGNMTLERLAEVAATGVDYISAGALTHSVAALDISMNIEETTEGQ